MIETIVALAILSVVGYYAYRSGKQTGSRKGFGAGPVQAEVTARAGERRITALGSRRAACGPPAGSSFSHQAATRIDFADCLRQLVVGDLNGRGEQTLIHRQHRGEM